MKPRPSFHHADLYSPRLQRVFRALLKRPMTTIKLGEACRSTRPASDVSECNHALRSARLRARIHCEYLGTKNGRRIYQYSFKTHK